MPDTAQNIILLSMDALQADHLSCYGYHRETSPVLDELASESLQFMNAYSASSHTREAVPALLTGEYPDVAIGPDYHLRGDTIAVTLSEEGFATGGFHSNPYISRAYGFDRGFDEFDDDLHLGQHKLIALAQRALDKLRNRHYARAETINKRSLEWLDSLDEDEPFFLWNHYMDTHGPYEPPEPYATQFRDDRVTDDRAQSLYSRALDDPDSITDEERALLIDLYDAEIRYNDAQIGLFLNALRERGLFEDSLLIVTADHGDAFGEQGYYGHPRFVDKELLSVPLLISHPSSTDSRINRPVSLLDIVPSILATTGQKANGLPGYPLFDAEGIRVERSGPVFASATGEGKDKGHRRFAAHDRNWCASVHYDANGSTIQSALTDSEGTVYDQDETPKSGQQLLERLREHIQSVDSKKSTSLEDEQSAEVERRLEALGYK